MPAAGYTHLSLVVDRSGSMQWIKEATDQGIRDLIKDQIQASDDIGGRMTVSLFTFDDTFQCEKDLVDIEEFGWFEVKPRGRTALYDAFGQGIAMTADAIKAMREAARPEKVIFVVVTDGKENASVEWKSEQVLDLVTAYTEGHDWHFGFIGVGSVDEMVEAGRSIGISPLGTMSYDPSTTGSTSSVYSSVSASISSTRRGAAFELPDEAKGD